MACEAGGSGVTGGLGVTVESTDAEPKESSADQSVENVDYGSQCTSRLAQLCNNVKFSDVTLVVGGVRYYAHKLLLATASDVFERMLTSDHWPEAGQSNVILQEAEECTEVFLDFLRYVYCGQVTLTCDSVLGLLVLADKYNIPDLKEACSTYMADHLVSMPDNNRAVTWYQYAIECSSPSLQSACYLYIALNLDTVLQSPDWVYLDKGNLTMLLQRSDVVVHNEYELLRGFTRWLQEDSRLTELVENLRDILPHIRFPMILPEHLAEFEASDFQKKNHEWFAPYLLTAYRYHALTLRGRGKRDSSLGNGCKSQFLYRNYTDESYSIHVDVVRKSFRTCPRVSSKVEKPLSVPASISNPAQDEMCKMKVTFYPQGFYTTSHWNGQLNLAKALDSTKMVISHGGGVDLQQAEISVIIYAQRNGVVYAAHQISAPHTFDTYGTFEIENVVDKTNLTEEDSPYLIDGAVYLKVFVRPISFMTEPQLRF